MLDEINDEGSSTNGDKDQGQVGSFSKCSKDEMNEGKKSSVRAPMYSCMESDQNIDQSDLKSKKNHRYCVQM